MTTKYSPKSGGGGNATELQGVPVSATPPTNGQGLVYNGTSWVPAAAAGNATELQGNPVSGAVPVLNNALIWNGTTWIPATTVNTVVGGTAITVGGTPAFPVINNAGVTSNVAGTGIGVSGATGAVTINNTGVTGAVAGSGITVSAPIGNVTISAPPNSGLIASHIYTPASNTSYTITTTVAPIDPVNITVTFTTGSSGNVIIESDIFLRSTNVVTASSFVGIALAFLDHITHAAVSPYKRFVEQSQTASVGTATQLGGMCCYRALINLTPNTVYNLDLGAILVENLGGTGVALADPGISGDVGPASIFVYATP
jgi:hypothetical protein